MRSMENKEYRKCRVWKMQIVENAECKKNEECRNCAV